jgi:hypothetical protein
MQMKFEEVNKALKNQKIDELIATVFLGGVMPVFETTGHTKQSFSMYVHPFCLDIHLADRCIQYS